MAAKSDLSKKLEQREAEIDVINSIQLGLLANKEMQEIYDLVGAKVRDLFDAQVAVVSTFSHENDTEIFHFAFEDGTRHELDPRPIDKLREKLIADKELILINENADEVWRNITGEEPSVAPGTKLTKSALYVPMVAGDTVLGYISLQNVDREHAFSDSDARLLSTMANSISMALENARLFNETEQRNAELAVINSVQEALASRLDMQGVYDLIGEHIRKIFDAQAVVIRTFDIDAGMERWHYAIEKGNRQEVQPRQIDDFARYLHSLREPLVINDHFNDFIIQFSDETSVEGETPKSAIFVPLIAGDIVGNISLQDVDREGVFNEDDVRLLATLANSMSVALENARLFNETEQRNAELSVINSVQEGLVAEMDLQGIYDLVGDRIRQLFDAQVTGIYTFDHESAREYFQYLFEDGERLYPESRPLDKIRMWLIQNKKLLLVNEDADETIYQITGEGKNAVPGTRLPKSLIFVPLIVGDDVRGCVSLQNLDHESAFSDSDVRLLSTLANSMSVALENARLFNETEQRNAELAVINSVQQGLVAEMDMQSIYDLVGDRIRDLFDAQVAMICTFDHESGKEHFQYQYEDGERLYPEPRPVDNFRKRLIKTKEMILINEHFPDRAEEILGIKPEAVPGTDLPKSVLFVPLIIGDSVKGYVSLQNLDHEQAFPESDVRLLSTLANSMSVALENARLFNETEQRNAELAVINSVQQGLVAEMNLQGIYDLVGDRIQNLFNAQSVTICTFDHEKSEELFQYNYENGERFDPDPRPIDNFRKRLIDTKELLLINDHFPEKAEEILGFKPKAVPGTHLPKSALFVPLIIGDSVRGYVSLQNIDIEFAFSDSDVRLLSTLANSMSVALENARLFNETTRLLAETEQRNAELAVINSVQDGLVREMDMEAIYKLVGERICDVLDTQTMIIRTFDHNNGLEYWQYAVEKGKPIEVEPRPFIWANKKLIETKKHLLINENYESIAMKYEGTAVTKGLAPKSAIFVPMMVGDTVMGSVSLQNVEEENAFSESDLQLISTLTNSMSVAIENARLFNETERRAAEMQTVNNISRALVSQLEFDKLIELVGEQMRETFKADIVYLALHNQKTNMLNFPYYYGDEAESRPFGNGITEKIILKKEPLLINQNLDDAYHKLKAEIKGEMVESYLGVPIMAGDKSIGVISVQSKEQANRFNENDLRLLTTIAANVGVAMQNAESYEKLRSALNDLKAAQTQLVQQEKLASLGQLTAGIAHEIKNPLNFVNNFSDLSVELIQEARDEVKKQTANGKSETGDGRREGDGNPLWRGDGIADGDDRGVSDEASNHSLLLEILDDIETNLKTIHKHGSRADSIVKSMLQHSRGGDGKLEPTPLNPLIKEYANLAFHGMRAGKDPINVDIDLQLDENIGNVPLIAEDFSRIILNLSNNAFDAMREKANGKHDAPGDYVPKLTIKTHQTENTVTIDIEDNGPGIPDEMRDKILQPFFTTKKGTDGTGLGLSITNDIVKAHGGEMKINSIPEKGTTFSIILTTN